MFSWHGDGKKEKRKRGRGEKGRKEGGKEEEIKKGRREGGRESNLLLATHTGPTVFSYTGSSCPSMSTS